MDLAALAARLRKHGEVSVNEFMLSAHITDGNKQFELTLFRDGRAIIKGTQEAKVARGIYAKYVGH
jgi:adenylyltransferase/sulfurtransferase